MTTRISLRTIVERSRISHTVPRKGRKHYVLKDVNGQILVPVKGTTVCDRVFEASQFLRPQNCTSYAPALGVTVTLAVPATVGEFSFPAGTSLRRIARGNAHVGSTWVVNPA